MQRAIVKEINRYASEIMDSNGRILRGDDSIPLRLHEFYTYLSICLFMGLKQLPNTRLYWCKEEPLFHCFVISRLTSRDVYDAITRCMHVSNVPLEHQDCNSYMYDKLHESHWLIEVLKKCLQEL